MELWIMCGSFVLLLLLGVPVAFSIGLASVATVLAADLPMAIVFQKMVGGMQIFSFLAIPFFIFAGELMLHGGIAERIVVFANRLVGHVRGGLGMSNVVGCTLFGGVAGSPLADVSAMGSVMIPLMKREGYDADYAVNVTTHSALVGALMPTSHNLIIYVLATAGIAAVSVFNLILAALLPALLLTVANLIAAYGVAVKRGYPTNGAFPGWGLVFSALLAAMPGLLVIVIILGGILSGVFTATESAATAVCWALIVTGLVYRTLSWKGFLAACAKACKTTGVVLLLIGISAAFGYFLALYEVPQKTGEWLEQMSGNQAWLIFLWVNVLLFLLGTFLDMAATILICTPIFLPICMKAGMDPTQFGVVMLLNCALGLNTPPVGSTQFVGCAIGGVSVGQVMRSIAPFYGALLVTLLAATYIPALSLALPAWVGG
ncbi:TRAP transporter large permease [Roseateles asaccharophilus]|uniref:TRAP transporter large permease protein n=1 Tax=Roseateles asaccharophilus TaxID=582607 RepID=A0ABU2AFC9_9BURK|nr:TRAP transporter large permease [Roseateles asaccharophilus]MDR7335910.1 tripartite ATP-independent transporter DctM subunit [Roseateles asaccharophilus]